MQCLPVMAKQTNVFLSPLVIFVCVVKKVKSQRKDKTSTINLVLLFQMKQNVTFEEKCAIWLSDDSGNEKVISWTIANSQVPQNHTTEEKLKKKCRQ